MKIVPILAALWLLVGAAAAAQRNYFDKGAAESCAKAGTVVVTVLAGPLNYAGANPKVTCKLPEPSG